MYNMLCVRSGMTYKTNQSNCRHLELIKGMPDCYSRGEDTLFVQLLIYLHFCFCFTLCSEALVLFKNTLIYAGPLTLCICEVTYSSS